MTVHINIHSFSAEVDPEVVSTGRAAAHIDGCPQCVGVYLRPVATVDDGESVVGHYHHRRCHKQWVTCWAKEGAPGVGIHGVAEPTPLGDVLRDVVADVARRRSQV